MKGIINVIKNLENRVRPWLMNKLAPMVKRRPVPFAIGGIIFLIAVGRVAFGGGDSNADAAFHKVERRDFLVSVVEGGELEAVNQNVIRCELDGQSRIIYIVPEGSYVEEGDLLVELDASELEDNITQKTIDVEQSRAALKQAEATLGITKSQNGSNMRDAQHQLTSANLALKKFDEMEATNLLVQANLDLISAEEQLKLAEDTLMWTTKLAEKGFETENRLDQDRFSFTNQFFNVTKASNQVEMLREYDLEIMRSDFELQVAAAKDNLERVELEGEGELAKAQADLEAKKSQLELNERQLAKLEGQMANSKIYAPEPGLVIYSVNQSRWSNESMIEEGATVRNRQELITLPDTSKMKVSLEIAESNISQISEGQLAYVIVESKPDQRFRGRVSRVAPVPSADSRFMGSNMKRYDTEIIIEEELPDIKPGVTAQAEIVVTNLTDTLIVPNQCIAMLNGKPVVYRESFRGVKPVDVELGLYDATYTQVINGIREGDQLSLTPPMSFDSDDMEGSVVRDGDEIAAEPQAGERPGGVRGSGEGGQDERPGGGARPPDAGGGDNPARESKSLGSAPGS